MAKIDEQLFSDVYFTPEGVIYVHDGETRFGLKELVVDDAMEFRSALEMAYNGRSSYSMAYGSTMYRVERISTLTGIHYTARRMPRKTPDVIRLGLPPAITNHLISLNREAGLILWAGPTGAGKTTSISCLMRKFLEREGGFAYTIEDPPEMPLDGLYQSKRGGLGLCKQTEPVNDDWGESLKSALRSRPRYILVGEIRTPDCASQILRAATSGHLVLSTIHANSVEDALNSVIKYASGGDLSEELAADLLSRGILAVIHQKLQGIKQMYPEVHFAFANPDPTTGDQLRIAIRDRQIALGTLMESQAARLYQGKPLFREADENKAAAQ
ncbi:MAG: Flp pilus assembly complex ATPase component TadA [Alphaproteobacteria bacterium]|nr:Flp pilus assembly complex ATPase component TadA [Alphaproteobacteria bacterium]